QELARFAVDAPDRVLERAHRLVEVGGLRVEVALALSARGELFQRGEVDRAELVDRLRDARDLALQARRARRALGLGGEHGFVGAGFGELACELVEIDLRRLLLQLELAEALAQRRGARFGLQAPLLEAAQRAG